mgnify:CR=1 FL=1
MDFRILIVEDEARLREVVCDYFRSRGDTPFEAENGLRALELIEDAEFDAVLLDIMMPELDGLSVCRALRRDNDVPIILLTALSDEEDKLLGYELGADDYVTKPFSLSVLYAKTAALIKRSRRQVLTGGRMEAGGIVLEDSTRRVWAGGRELALTPKEYDILYYLMQHPGKVYTPAELYSAVWNEAPVGIDNTVAVHIRHLREKLEIDPSNPRYLKVVWGKGYKLEGDRQ